VNILNPDNNLSKDNKDRFSKKGGKLRHANLGYVFLFLSLIVGTSCFAQAPNINNTSDYLTLDQCIDYALHNQPVLKQSVLNLSVTKTNNAINISGWLPQVGVSATYMHYNQLPTALVTLNNQPPTPEHTGVSNTMTPTFSVTQAIFSPSLLYYASSAHLFTKLSAQGVDSAKIGIVSNVSKTFYNLLLTIEEISVLKEDTVRLYKNYLDAYHQYVGGIVDETDYDEASISLNNSRAQLRQTIENVRPNYASLKQMMGYPPEKNFNISFDTAQMARDINLDTTEQLNYEKRVEFQELQTAKAIQQKLITYNWLTFLPTANVYYDYIYELESNTASDLFQHAYPYSYIGVGLTLPIFTGLSRVEGIHKAKLQGQILELAESSLKSEIYTEYTTALANYKGNLYNLQMMQENVGMAKRVYAIVGLQYKQGIVPYLNVITAESNLISSEIGYLNALAQLLSNKIDLEKSMGNIPH
jgi:outer membrane protein TolC